MRLAIQGILDPGGPALAPRVPQSTVPEQPTTRTVWLWRPRTGAWASSATASETSESIAAQIEKEVQAEFELKGERKQVKMRQEGRTRQGMNRLVATRQSVLPNRVCPTSQRVRCQDVGGVLLTCLKALAKWSPCISVPSAPLPNAVLGVGSR